jgi:hypothetical protein
MTVVWAQAPDPYEKVDAAIDVPIQKQPASVNHQIKAAQPVEEAFFVLPSPRPLAVDPIPVVQEPDCEPIPPDHIDPVIEEISKREGLTPDLLRVIIQKESAFRPCAVSRKGARGLMQLMPATAEQLGVLDPFDPKQNIDGGARFLKQLLNRYGGNLRLALGAYNAGPGQVDPYLGLPMFPETLNDVSNILRKVSQGEVAAFLPSPNHDRDLRLSRKRQVDDLRAPGNSELTLGDRRLPGIGALPLILSRPQAPEAHRR